MALDLETAIKRMKQASLKVEPFIEPNPAKEQKELAKYKDDVYPRADSYSLKDIVNLYDTKGETSYEYKHNIMEDAHPEPLIMFPAYDKMNALVENHIERQKINLNILRKPVSGNEYRQKYAAELMSALTAVANEMEFRHNEPLCKLADRTISHFKKEAFGLEDAEDWIKSKLSDAGDIAGGAETGAEIGAIAGGLIGAFTGVGGIGGAWAGSKLGGLAGGAIGGLISSIAKTGPVAKTVAINAKIAKSKLDALIKEHQNDMFLPTLDTALTHIQDTAATYASLVSQIQSDKSADQSKVAQLGAQYITEIKQLDAMIDTFLDNANTGKYVADESDWVAKIKSPFRSILGDTAHDAVGAMKTLEQVSKEAVAGINETKTHASSLGEPAPKPPSEPPAHIPGNLNELDELRKALSEE